MKILKQAIKNVRDWGVKYGLVDAGNPSF